MLLCHHILYGLRSYNKYMNYSIYIEDKRKDHAGFIEAFPEHTVLPSNTEREREREGEWEREREGEREREREADRQRDVQRKLPHTAEVEPTLHRQRMTFLHARVSRQARDWYC